MSYLIKILYLAAAVSAGYYVFSGPSPAEDQPEKTQTERERTRTKTLEEGIGRGF